MSRSKKGAVCLLTAVTTQLFLGPLLHLLDVFGVLRPAIWYIAILCAVAPLGFIVLYSSIHVAQGSALWKKGFSSFKLPPAFSILLLASFCLLIFHCYVSYLAPTEAWDVLTLWGRFSQLAAIYLAEPSGTEPFALWWNKHPASLIYFSSFAAFLSKNLLVTDSGYLQWYLFSLLFVGISLCAFLIIGGVGLRKIALCIPWILAPFPLYENHILLAGYSELAVGLGLSCSFLALLSSLCFKDRKLLYAALLISFSVIFMRNTGVFYFGCFFVAWLCAFFYGNVAKFSISLAFSIIVCIVFLTVGVKLPFVTEGMGLIKIDWAERSLQFAGYALPFQSQNISGIFKNQYHAFIVNQSLGVSFIVLLLLSLAGISRRKYNFDQPSLVFIRCLVIFVALGLFGLLASQLTAYGFVHAVPGGDTGNTRFTMPLIMPMTLGVAVLLRWLEVRSTCCDRPW